MNPVLSPIGGSTGFIFREIKTEWQMNDRIGMEWQNEKMSWDGVWTPLNDFIMIQEWE